MFGAVAIRVVLLIVVLTAASPLPVIAGAPRPIKPVPLGLYSGRWFEVARTPNLKERGCKAATSEFAGMRGGAFEVIETCRHASGPPSVTRSKAALLPGSNNTKFCMSLLGGLLHAEFWILDTAPNGDWAIMATPGGHYVWLLSRQAALPLGEKARALARVSTLGYAVGKLEYD